MILRPFFRYFGGKWRATRAGLYPAPQFKRLYEPFAGSAGYALNHPHHEVTLVDRDPVIVGIWRWLVSATPDEVRSIPLVDSVDDLPAWVPLGARDLIGFSMNAATTSPRKTLSASARKLRDAGRRFYGWTIDLRERVATQVPFIKHWQVHQGDFSLIANRPNPRQLTTWFIDSPYELMGAHYTFGPKFVNYGVLADFCRSLPGQVIACEAAGANWLPFVDAGSIKAGPRSRVSREVVWIKEAA